MNTYEWLVDSMVVSTQNNVSNVVSGIYYRVNGLDENLIYRTTVSGYTEIAYDPAYPFIQYDGLTANQVIGWVKGSIGSDAVNNIVSQIDTEINNIVNAPVTVLAPPWSQSE